MHQGFNLVLVDRAQQITNQNILKWHFQGAWRGCDLPLIAPGGFDLAQRFATVCTRDYRVFNASRQKLLKYGVGQMTAVFFGGQPGRSKPHALRAQGQRRHNMPPRGHAASRQYGHTGSSGHVHNLRQQRKRANRARVGSRVVALCHQRVQRFGECTPRMFGRTHQGDHFFAGLAKRLHHVIRRANAAGNDIDIRLKNRLHLSHRHILRTHETRTHARPGTLRNLIFFVD